MLAKDFLLGEGKEIRRELKRDFPHHECGRQNNDLRIIRCYPRFPESGNFLSSKVKGTLQK